MNVLANDGVSVEGVEKLNQSGFNVITESISQEVIDQYAEASGDFNPIHIDQQFAKNSPFNSTIAHGLMIAASISHMLSETFGISWANSGQLSLRFRNEPLKW